MIMSGNEARYLLNYSGHGCKGDDPIIECSNLVEINKIYKDNINTRLPEKYKELKQFYSYTPKSLNVLIFQGKIVNIDEITEKFILYVKQEYSHSGNHYIYFYTRGAQIQDYAMYYVEGLKKIGKTRIRPIAKWKNLIISKGKYYNVYEISKIEEIEDIETQEIEDIAKVNYVKLLINKKEINEITELKEFNKIESVRVILNVNFNKKGIVYINPRQVPNAKIWTKVNEDKTMNINIDFGKQIISALQKDFRKIYS